VTGLTEDTPYTFTVKQACSNTAANSPTSINFGVTTSVTVANFAKICQGGGTCDCGNVTSCSCQLTDVCNCGSSDICTCQLGVCNGGYSRLFTCQSTTCNRQCAETCIGLCPISIPGLGRRLMGKAGCVISGTSALAANALLVVVFALFAWN
jgi:hypothetical protein